MAETIYQAEGGETWWAVWSPSGAHVGLWSDKETAEGVLAEFGAGGTIKQLRALAPAPASNPVKEG